MSENSKDEKEIKTEEKNKEPKNEFKKVQKEEAKVEPKKESKAEVKAEPKKEEKSSAKFEKVSSKEAEKMAKEQSKEIKKENKKEPKKENKEKAKSKKGKKAILPVAIVIAVIVVIIALTIMMGVSTDPKKSFDALLTNLKAGNFDEAQTYISNSDGNGDISNTSLDAETQKLLYEKLSWNIKKVTKEKDTATLEVEVTNKDFQTVVNNYAKKVLNVAKGAIGGSTNISEQDFTQYFVEELQKDDIQTVTTENKITAVKVDGKWKIVYDENLVNLILPGLEEARNTIDISQ